MTGNTKLNNGKVVYLFEEDNVVLKKTVKAGIEKHTVTLYYYPEETDTELGQTIVTKQAEWQVEVDVGGFFRESYHKNEKSARWSYDLINENFIASVIVWHGMKKDASDYHREVHEIHYNKVFNGRNTKHSERQGSHK